MKDIEPIDPMEPGLHSLLDAAKTADVAPAAARSRLNARLATALALGATAATAAAVPAAAKLGAGGSLARLAWPVVTAFALGGAAGAAVVRATYTREPPQIVYVDRPVASPSPSPSPAPSGSAPVAAPSASAAPAPVTAPSTASSRGESGAAERLLLDGARIALERGDGAGALAAAERHARTYPAGALAQEREAIAIRALLMLGRKDEAQARARRFVTHFPDSLLRPAVEAAVANP